MQSSTRSIQVFSPSNLSELLSVLKRRQSARLFAGGTHLLRERRGTFPSFDTNLISIGHIEELARINRTERYLEIGACAPINKILAVGTNVLPAVLSQALRNIGSYPIRNRATLGGNLCVAERRLTTFPVLLLLDARLEIRQSGGSRWIPVNRLVGPEGNLTIAAGEMLTRIRIPFGDWDAQVYRSVSPYTRQGDWSISFCGLAEKVKDTLTELRVAYGSMGKTVIRDRSIEAELAGRKLPVARREIDAAAEAMEQVALNAASPVSSYQQMLVGRFMRWFLSMLDPE